MTDEEISIYAKKYSKDEEVLILLDKYAYLLQEFGCEILNDDLNILVEIRKMRKIFDKEHNCNSFLY